MTNAFAWRPPIGHADIAPSRFERIEGDGYFTLDSEWIVPALLGAMPIKGRESGSFGSGRPNDCNPGLALSRAKTSRPSRSRICNPFVFGGNASLAAMTTAFDTSAASIPTSFNISGSRPGAAPGRPTPDAV